MDDRDAGARDRRCFQSLRQGANTAFCVNPKSCERWSFVKTGSGQTERKLTKRRFAQDGSGSFSVRELQQLIRTMGQRMSDTEVLELAKHVDSDGSGEIDLDELKILLRPMMSLSDYASFNAELEPAYGICGGPIRLVISGVGIQLNPVGESKPSCECVQCQKVTTTLAFSKVVDIREREEGGGLIIVPKITGGELAQITVKCKAGTTRDIMEAVKKQQGKLSLRSTIARSKEPKDSTIGTALLVLRTEAETRTQAQLKMLHTFLGELFESMELDTELRQMQCCRYLRAERYATGDVLFQEGSVAWCEKRHF